MLTWTRLIKPVSVLPYMSSIICAPFWPTLYCGDCFSWAYRELVIHHISFLWTTFRFLKTYAVVNGSL